MNGLNVGQLLIAVVALLMLMTPLFVLTFLAGRRSRVTGAHRQFERMHPDIVLPAGQWHVEFDGIEPNTTQVVLIELQQVGSRIVGTGHSLDGTKHSLEGILHQRGMCCICIDENRDGIWLATVTAELLPGEQRMSGMRNQWSPQSQALIVRKATFTRVGSMRPVLDAVH